MKAQIRTYVAPKISGVFYLQVDNSHYDVPCSNLTLIIDMILIITGLIIKKHSTCKYVNHCSHCIRVLEVNKYNREHGTTIGDENGSKILGN